MLLLQDSLVLPSTVPGWLPEALFWVAVAALVAVVVCALGVWSVVGRLASLAQDTKRLGTLERVSEDLSRLSNEREELDLRRIEHVLVDMRDAHVRLEEALLRTLESQTAGAEREMSVPHAVPDSLSERVVNRLLSLGFSQVQLVTPIEEVQALCETDGDVVIEAKRNGVLHKGRVLVRQGRLAEVEVQPFYAIFP